MTAINLLPVTEQQKRKIDLLNYYTLIGGIVTVVGTLVLAGFFLAIDQIYKVNLDALKAQKAQAEGQAALYLDVEKKARDLENQLVQLKKAQAQTTHWASTLTDLQAITPPSVSVKTFIVKQGTASSQKNQISGTADSRRSVGEFQLALSKSPYFKNVNIETSSLAGSNNLVDFVITFETNFDKLNGPPK